MGAGAIIGMLGALGGLGVLALSAQPASAKTNAGPALEQTYTLDANMPEGLRNQVLGALTTETNPATIEQFAKSIETQYPLSAFALRTKEALLLGRQSPSAPSGPPNVIDLDPGIDSATQTQVVRMLEGLDSGQDQAALQLYANQIASRYPRAATQLRRKAWILRGMQGPQPTPDYPGPLPIEGGVPTPAPAPPAPAPSPAPAPPIPSPTPSPAPAPSPTVGPIIGTGTGPNGLDANLPPPIASSVVTAWQTESDPAKLRAFATTLRMGQFPIAASVLEQRPSQLGGGVTPPAPSPAPTPVTPAQPSPPPAPVTPTPVSPFGQAIPGLDPGLPPDVAAAVTRALLTETDPAKLEGLAASLQSQYPLTAGLLTSKARVLRSISPPSPSPSPQPAPSPVPPSPNPPAPSPSPVPPWPFPVPPVTPPWPSPSPPPTPTPTQYPIGDDSTRTGRNELRPIPSVFLLIRRTDSIWPAKMADLAVGSEARYVDLNPLNPHRAPGGQWTNLYAGDAINIPWSWAPKLKLRGYLIQQDPGASPDLPIGAHS